MLIVAQQHEAMLSWQPWAPICISNSYVVGRRVSGIISPGVALFIWLWLHPRLLESR